ncbi:unnamed protein product [Boreogadus saida]
MVWSLRDFTADGAVRHLVPVAMPASPTPRVSGDGPWNRLIALCEGRLSGQQRLSGGPRASGRRKTGRETLRSRTELLGGGCGSFPSVITHASRSAHGGTFLMRMPKKRQQRDSVVTVVTDPAVRTPARAAEKSLQKQPQPILTEPESVSVATVSSEPVAGKNTWELIEE